MSRSVRLLLLTVLAATMVLGPASAANAFGVASFFAANCSAGHETCEKHGGTRAEETKAAQEEGLKKAAGHPNFGVTEFTVETTGVSPKAEPTATVTHLRTDVAPGVATNPEAVTECSIENFGNKEVAPGAFPPPNCPESELGKNEVVVYVPSAKADVPLSGKVYNLEPKSGLASEFGVALNLKPIVGLEVFAHTIIEGHI